MTTSVGEDFPIQQARVRALIDDYRALPNNAGAFGALMMEQTLQRADAAQASGDVIEILCAYQEMTEWNMTDSTCCGSRLHPIRCKPEPDQLARLVVTLWRCGCGRTQRVEIEEYS